MQIDSAERLVDVLRSCGLFDSEQLAAIARDLSAIGGDVQKLYRHLVNKKRITVYQLRKVIQGKGAELFLGPYIIADKLGEGGMGKVYRARNASLDREVALKVVRTSLIANPLVRKRYDREVLTASSLKHPNVVGVCDAGEIDGKYYMAMEFVDGIDLSRMMRDYRPLEVAEACEYVRQAALGLHYAHEQGLVHRDIKPSNIIVSGSRHVPQATEPAVVKILDLGLVRTVGFDDGGAGREDLTRAGTVVGTPDYMSPEQAKNSSGVDCRADLYSIGCTLYFLLSGQPPFPTGTAIEKLIKHQLEAPTPLQALRRDVPTSVAEVVAKLLSKKPEQRCQTAAELAEILAPLSVYAEGAAPVEIRSRSENPKSALEETFPTAGRSTIPPFPSSIDRKVSNSEARSKDSSLQATAPSDHTPNPVVLSKNLQAALEGDSPFSNLTEPASGPQRIANLREPFSLTEEPLRRNYLWLAAAAIALGIIVLGLWLASGSRSRKVEPSPPDEPVAAKRDTDIKVQPRTGLIPAVNLTRLSPWADLIVDDPGLVLVGYPASYLLDKDTPFARGSGPTKLVNWVDQFAVTTGMPISRTERLVLSASAGRMDTFLAVCEGDYINPSFAAGLATNVNLRPLKNPEAFPANVKLFQAPLKRHAALIPLHSVSQVYALTSNLPLLNNLVDRLSSTLKSHPAHFDAGMLSALKAAHERSLPLIMAVAGPSFQLPDTLQPQEGKLQSLRELGIDLVEAQLQIPDRMEISLAVTGKDEKSVRDFIAGLKRKIGDEYPINGAGIANFLSGADQSGQKVDGKHRLTIKASWTLDRWSSFLDRLFFR